MKAIPDLPVETSDSPHNEWPMEIYMTVWKSFRENCDEDVVTADHLLSRPAWPAKDDLVICDVGCGDGRLLEAILQRTRQTRVAEVRLIDPDQDLLNQATRRIKASGIVQKVIKQPGYAHQLISECSNGADVVVVVHVAYLMSNDQFQKMLLEVPPGIPSYIVLDAQNSVFMDLWRRTASKYYYRALRAHEYISKLRQSRFAVTESNLDAGIQRSLFDGELGPWLRSLLCYRDMTENVDQETISFVDETLDYYQSEDNAIRCRSICYEIIRS